MIDSDSDNVRWLKTVAEGLDELLDDVVFVGGVVAPFYIKDKAAFRIRSTDDVDCVVNIAQTADYYKLEAKLRERGFSDDMSDEAPICRKVYKGIKVDIMAHNSSVLGFTNRWYEEGSQNPERVKLPSGIEISVFTLPYFIASKIEAFLGSASTFESEAHPGVPEGVYGVIRFNQPFNIRAIRARINYKPTLVIHEPIPSEAKDSYQRSAPGHPCPRGHTGHPGHNNRHCGSQKKLLSVLLDSHFPDPLL